MKKILSLLVLCVVLCVHLLAHEFWLAPHRYRAQKSDPIAIRFWVGEGFVGTPWGAKSKRLKTLSLFHGKGKMADLSASAKTDTVHSTTISIPSEGTALVALTSENSFITLDGEKFSAYLLEDGLTDILQQRKMMEIANNPARELYCRFAKTLIQVGNKKVSNHGKVLGTALEIVPIQNPYTLNDGDKLSVQLIFEQKPLCEAVVKIWHHNYNDTNQTTPSILAPDSNGILTFPVQTKGEWMVSVVKMIPHSNPQEADYQSYWASLTFGY